MEISTASGNTYDLSPAAMVDYSTKQLLEIHNELADTALKSWKQSKPKLIQRITEVGNLVSVKTIEPAKAAELCGQQQTGTYNDSETTAKKIAKKKKAKAKKAAKPRAMPKSYLMLQLIVEASEQGVGCSTEALADQLNTSKGSIASYVSYFRKGVKGHDKIDIATDRELGGFYLVTADDIAAAQAGIDARTPKEAA